MLLPKSYVVTNSSYKYPKGLPPIRAMSLFPHRELTYYFFGLRAGFANLFTNWFQLGFKKTAGKIMQPINSYTRFPEYYWFDAAISSYLARLPAGSQARA